MKRAVLLAMTLMLVSVSAKRNSGRKQERCDENYREGIQMVKEGRNSRAVQKLSTVRIECIGGIAEPDTLYYFLGEAYLAGKKPAEARLEYRTIIEDYPHSKFLEEAAYKMAYCSYKSAPITERDNRIIRRAMREFNTFMADYPYSEWVDSAAIYVDSIYNQLIVKEMANAHFYEIVEQWDAAIIYYRSILADYPGNKRTDEIKLKIIDNLINAHRYTEAREMIADLADQGLYIDKLQAANQKIERMIAKQKKANQRKERRKKRESEVEKKVEETLSMQTENAEDAQ
jgi:outer membrane protein assembly factor BamD